MNALLLWKMAHVVSAAILFGTGLGIAFFCWFGYRAAMRDGSIDTLRSALRLTVMADACFTAPAVIFQAISGRVLMKAYGWPLASAWSLAAWGLFLLAGACWLPVLFIQAKLSRESRQAASASALPAKFHRMFRWWFALGVPAFAAVIAIYYLMVTKALSVTGT